MRLVEQPVLFGTDPLVGWSDGEVEVRVIDKDRACAVIRSGHYSGTTCWASNEHFGVFVGGELVGALQYGPLMNPASAPQIVAGSTPTSALELNRMWLADEKPRNTTTRAIAFSLRVLRSRRPGLEWVQSFADERCGGLGVVYQAASFLYCGEHEATFYELDGEWFHKSAVGRSDISDHRGWGVGPRIRRFNAERHRAVEHTFRQFRYIRPLNRAARKRLLLPALPYPKPQATEATQLSPPSSHGRRAA